MLPAHFDWSQQKCQVVTLTTARWEHNTDYTLTNILDRARVQNITICYNTGQLEQVCQKREIEGQAEEGIFESEQKKGTYRSKRERLNILKRI